jgi:hypothetical protein
MSSIKRESAGLFRVEPALLKVRIAGKVYINEVSQDQRLDRVYRPVVPKARFPYQIPALYPRVRLDEAEDYYRVLSGSLNGQI